ncbi:MAG: HNH endonuclease [Acidobacteriales bacterium]|nr:HNH endonuclease [Terriglobales bacterium]
MKITKDKASAFWQKIDKDGPMPDQSNPHYIGLNRCWIWTGRTNHNGYGRISVSFDGKRIMARTHRISWEIHHGKIPDGMLVLHRCDNPACANPDHLFLGSHQDNQNDCTIKNRKNGRRGKRRPYGPRDFTVPRVLTQNQVDEIRAMRRNLKVSCSEIAKIYGVSRAMVWLIVTGKAWKRPAPV